MVWNGFTPFYSVGSGHHKSDVALPPGCGTDGQQVIAGSLSPQRSQPLRALPLFMTQKSQLKVTLIPLFARAAAAVGRRCVCAVRFLPVCYKVPFCVRGECCEWRPDDPPPRPSTAGRRLPPLRALRQNVPGSTRQRLKALSPVHRPQVAPGSLATRLDRWSLHAERGKHKDSCVSQLTCSIREVAVHVGPGVTFHAE